jgi:hypothetical protein
MEDNNNPIKKSIDDLLNDDHAELPAPSGSGLPSFQMNEPVDYDEMKNVASNESKKLMNSLLKFYLSNELIEKNDYIKAKAKVDMMTQAGLIKQLQIYFLNNSCIINYLFYK